jgi:hypothetical protein
MFNSWFIHDLKVKRLKIITSADKEKIKPLYTLCFYWFLLDKARNSTVVSKNTNRGIRRFY